MEIQGSKPLWYFILLGWIVRICSTTREKMHSLFSNSFLLIHIQQLFFRRNCTTVPNFGNDITPSSRATYHQLSRHAKTSTIWIVTGYCRQTMPNSKKKQTFQPHVTIAIVIGVLPLQPTTTTTTCPPKVTTQAPLTQPPLQPRCSIAITGHAAPRRRAARMSFATPRPDGKNFCFNHVCHGKIQVYVCIYVWYVYIYMFFWGRGWNTENTQTLK